MLTKSPSKILQLDGSSERLANTSNVNKKY